MSSATTSLRRPARRLSVVFALLLFATAIGSGMVGMVEARDHRRLRHPEPYYTLAGPAPTRRHLAGPGSSPPTCRARCGRCYPCRPVHVAIQPGRSVPLEYYPEAWRCKCGNKLFMP